MEPHRAQSTKNRGPRLRTLFLAILILGVVARLVRYALNFPLWGDEAFVAVNYLVADYRGLIKPLIYNQIVPLVFMWAELAATQTLGLSEYALRLLPVAAGVGGLLLFWRFLTRNFDQRTAVLALGFLAAAYYPIRHAAEVKAYSTDLFFALVMIVVTTEVLRRPRSRSAWIALLVLAPAVVWWSYPSIFVLAAVGCVLLILAWRQRSPAIWLGVAYFTVSVLLSFGAMYFRYAKPHAAAVPQITAIQMWDEAFPPMGKPWLLIWWFISIHAGNMLAYPIGGKTFGSIVTAILVVIGALALARRRGWWHRKLNLPPASHSVSGDVTEVSYARLAPQPRPDDSLAFRRMLLILLVGPLPFNLIAAALEKYPYGSTMRISLYMAPAFCTLAGLGATTLIQRFVRPPVRRKAFQIAAGAFALIAAGMAVADIAIPYKKEANHEARRVVREFGQRIAPTDQVVILNALKEETPYAPWIRPWKGDGAQFIYYLSMYVEPKLRAADSNFPRNVRPLVPDVGKIRWSPPPAAVRPAPGGATTWLLFFHGGNFKNFYNEPQVRDYIDQLSETLGPPEKIPNVLQRKKNREGQEVIWQEIDIYRFPPRAP